MFARLGVRPGLLQVHPRTPPLHAARTIASYSRPAVRSSRLLRLGFAAGAVLTTSLLLGHVSGTVYADAEAEERKGPSERSPTPLSTLIRSYIVYSACSVPALVDLSPTTLSVLFAIPGIKQVTEAIVRVTFFNQFVGGDTAEDAIPLVEQLRAENKGCLFAYSVEVDEEEAADKTKDKQAKQSMYKQIIAETLHCVDVAADFEDKHSVPGVSGARGRRTWVAIKLSAMLPHPEALVNFSKHLISSRPAPSTPVAFPGRPHPTDLDVLSTGAPAGSSLTDEDVADLRQLRDDLRAICTRAKERNIKIIVDAEYSWYQPAFDAFALSLQREFNRLPRSSWFRSSPGLRTPTVQPLVYQTYQAYLRRTPEYLKQSLEAARAEGYSLGVKLVRGAYQPHEVAAHAAAASGSPSEHEHGHAVSISPDPAPPVWATKAETDACYNACAALLLRHVRADIDAARAGAAPGIGVLFGSHNWRSMDLILGEMAYLGLGSPTAEGVVWVPEEVTERVALGQLYGMSDALTNSLVDRTRSVSPFVLKYVPYGNLTEVMPYLSRRAIENKSVLGDGGAADERKRAGAEIWARLFG
ncbi:FAD-linked oxidoreductase [Wolfiporia cocos MD-104 SS10]|uniref:Proline dehydrogenase n=1 Tax=Wolfiporia cocos (strain MD-104) TaxID=742152 RepID=A0A2H3ISV4_WOLCO|nr:FAD-linked oxidoreductase [Wolfiporia cocos MD-104 SS10]